MNLSHIAVLWHQFIGDPGFSIHASGLILLACGLSLDIYQRSLARWPAALRRHWFNPVAIRRHERQHPKHPSVLWILLLLCAGSLSIATVILLLGDLPSFARWRDAIVPINILIIGVVLFVQGELKGFLPRETALSVLCGTSVALIAVWLKLPSHGTSLTMVFLLAAVSCASASLYARSGLRSAPFLGAFLFWFSLYV